MKTGKVAEIIDNRTLAINLGSKEGVKIGMIFQIFAKSGKSIKDPDSREELGTIKIPKIRVKVTYADELYSLAETFLFKEVNEGGINVFNPSKIFATPRYVKEYETFDIEQSVKREIDKEKSIIKVGDIAELITDKTEIKS